jgi:small subunit ribosomal protein S16
MSVKIRLRRTGRKKQPSYRLVVADSATPRNGQYLDALGTYNPLVKPADLRIDLVKVDEWIGRGAEMSDTVASLVRKARVGGDSKVAVRGVGPDAKPEPASVAPAAEPSKPARAGSRGSAKAEAAARPAEAVAEPAAPVAEPAAAAAAPAEAAAEPAAAVTEPAETSAADAPESPAEPSDDRPPAAPE